MGLAVAEALYLDNINALQVYAENYDLSLDHVLLAQMQEQLVSSKPLNILLAAIFQADRCVVGRPFR